MTHSKKYILLWNPVYPGDRYILPWNPTCINKAGPSRLLSLSQLSLGHRSCVKQEGLLLLCFLSLNMMWVLTLKTFSSWDLSQVSGSWVAKPEGNWSCVTPCHCCRFPFCQAAPEPQGTVICTAVFRLRQGSADRTGKMGPSVGVGVRDSLTHSFSLSKKTYFSLRHAGFLKK